MSNKSKSTNQPDSIADKKAKGKPRVGLSAEQPPIETQPSVQPSVMDTGLANSSRPTSSLADIIGEPRTPQYRIRATSYCSDGRRLGVSTHFTSNDTVCILNDQTGQSVVVASNQSTRDALASLCQRESEVERREAAAAKMAMQEANLQAMLADEARRYFQNGSMSRVWEDPKSMGSPIARVRAQSVQFSQPRPRNYRNRLIEDTGGGFNERELAMIKSCIERGEVDSTGMEQLFPNRHHMFRPINKMQSDASPRPTVPAQVAVNESATATSFAMESMMPLGQSYTGLTIAECLQSIGDNGLDSSLNNRSHFGMSRFLEAPPPKESNAKTIKSTPKRPRKSATVRSTENGARVSNTINYPQNCEAIDAKKNKDCVLSPARNVAAVVAPVTDSVQQQPEPTKDFRALFAELTIPASVREGIRRVAERKKNGKPSRPVTGLLSNRSRSAPCNKTDEELIAFLKEPLALAKAAELEAIRRRMMEPPPKRKSRAKSSTAAATMSRSAPIDVGTVQLRTDGQDGGDSSPPDGSRSHSTPTSSQCESLLSILPMNAQRNTSPESELKHLKTDWTTGTQEMAGRNSIRLDMPLGQALQEVSLGAVAGQLRVQREMYEKVDTPEAKVHIQNQPQLYQQNPLANQQVFEATPPKPKRVRTKQKTIEEIPGAETQTVPAIEKPKRKRPPRKKAVVAEIQVMEIPKLFERVPEPEPELDPATKHKMEIDRMTELLATKKITQEEYSDFLAKVYDSQSGAAAMLSKGYEQAQSGAVRETSLAYQNSYRDNMPSTSSSDMYYASNDAIYQAAPVTTQQNRSQSNDSSTSAYQAYEALMEPSTSGTSMMQITGSQNTYASTSQCLYAQYPPSSSSQPYSYNSQNFNAFGCSNGPLSKPVPITHAGKGQAQIENEQEHVEDTVRFDISSEWAKIRTERLLFYSLYADRSGGLEPQRRPHHTVQYDGGNGYEPVLGAVVNSDGSLTLHDGTHLRANGTILRPNGVMINFDGSVCPPDGFVYDKFGNVRMPGGEYLFRNGYILGMDGIFIRPDTSVFNLPKRSMSLAQCIDMICSDLIVKFYVIPSDVTPAAQYAADAITCHNAFRAQTRSLNNPISNTNNGSLSNNPVNSYSEISISQANDHNHSVIHRQLPNNEIPVAENYSIQSIAQQNGTQQKDMNCSSSDIQNLFVSKSSDEQMQQSPGINSQDLMTTDQFDMNSGFYNGKLNLSQNTAFNQPSTHIEQGHLSSKGHSNAGNNDWSTVETNGVATHQTGNIQKLAAMNSHPTQGGHAITNGHKELAQPDSEQISFIQYLPNQVSRVSHGNNNNYNARSESPQQNEQMSSPGPIQSLPNGQFPSVGHLVAQSKKYKKATQNAKKKQLAMSETLSKDPNRQIDSPIVSAFFNNFDQNNIGDKIQQNGSLGDVKVDAEKDTVNETIDSVLQQVMNAKKHAEAVEAQREAELAQSLHMPLTPPPAAKKKKPTSRSRNSSFTTRAVMVQQSLMNTCQTGALERQQERLMQQQQQARIQVRPLSQPTEKLHIRLPIYHGTVIQQQSMQQKQKQQQPVHKQSMQQQPMQHKQMQQQPMQQQPMQQQPMQQQPTQQQPMQQQPMQQQPMQQQPMQQQPMQQQPMQQQPMQQQPMQQQPMQQQPMQQQPMQQQPMQQQPMQQQPMQQQPMQQQPMQQQPMQQQPMQQQPMQQQPMQQQPMQQQPMQQQPMQQQPMQQQPMQQQPMQQQPMQQQPMQQQPMQQQPMQQQPMQQQQAIVTHLPIQGNQSQQFSQYQQVKQYQHQPVVRHSPQLMQKQQQHKPQVVQQPQTAIQQHVTQQNFGQQQVVQHQQIVQQQPVVQQRRRGSLQLHLVPPKHPAQSQKSKQQSTNGGRSQQPIQQSMEYQQSTPPTQVLQKKVKQHQPPQQMQFNQSQQQQQQMVQQPQQQVVKLVPQFQTNSINQNEQSNERYLANGSPLLPVQLVPASSNSSSKPSSRPPSHPTFGSREVHGVLTHNNSRSSSVSQSVRIQLVPQQQSLPSTLVQTPSPQEVQPVSPQEKEGEQLLRIVKEQLAAEEAGKLQAAAKSAAILQPIVKALAAPKVNATVRVRHMRETINEIVALGPLKLEEAVDFEEDENIDDVMETYNQFFDLITQTMKENPIVPEIGVEDVLNNPELEPALHGRFRKRLAAVREGRTTQTSCPKKRKATTQTQEAKRKKVVPQKQVDESVTPTEVLMTEETLSQDHSDESQQPFVSINTTSRSSVEPLPAISADITPFLSVATEQPFEQELPTGGSPANDELVHASVSYPSTNQPSTPVEQQSAASSAPSVSVDHVHFLDEEYIYNPNKSPILQNDVMLSQAVAHEEIEDFFSEPHYYSDADNAGTSQENYRDDELFNPFNNNLIDLDYTHNNARPATPSNGLMDDYQSEFSTFDLLHCSPMQLHLDIPLQNDTVTSSSDLANVALCSPDPLHGSPLPFAQAPFHNPSDFEEVFIQTTEPATNNKNMSDETALGEVVDVDGTDKVASTNAALVTREPSEPIDLSEMPELIKMSGAQERPRPLKLLTLVKNSESSDMSEFGNMTVSDLLIHASPKKRIFKKRLIDSTKIIRTNFKNIAKEQAADLGSSIVEQLQYKTTRHRGNEFLSPKAEQTCSGFHLMDQLQEKELTAQSPSETTPQNIRELISKHVPTTSEPTPQQNQKPYAEVIEKMQEETTYLMTKVETDKKANSVQEVIVEQPHNEPPVRRGFIHWPGSAGYGELTIFDRNAIRIHSELVQEETSSSVNDNNMSPLDTPYSAACE